MVLIAGNNELAARAAAVMPGGVNSSNRVLAWPLVVRSASGAQFTDADGKTYLDYHAAFGPIVLGHNHPSVNRAVIDAMSGPDLMGVGTTAPEIELTEAISNLVPAAERVVLGNSGSEATYAALRLSRAATGRKKIVKFQGTYHGWHDAVALNVISRPEMVGQPDPLSLGMVDEAVANTVVLPFNNVEALRRHFAERGSETAAVILEPIPHNIGCVLPHDDFLAALRELTHDHGSILIFDEVITGFRHALGGFQSLVGISPDLATFAKAMANGYPIAALVGRQELLDRLAPGGGVFYAGTYNGHPMSVAAALATIAELRDGSVHRRTKALAAQAADAIELIGRETGIPILVARFGSVFVPYFMEGPVDSYTDLLRNDTRRDVWFRTQMCERGIFMLPTALKRNHVSAAHSEADIERTITSARDVLRSMPADY